MKNKCPLPEGVSCDYRQQIQQLEEDLEQFTYLISHDLREPLMAIAGFATLLKKRCVNLDAKSLHFLEQIVEGSERMEHKLDDLLSFSRAGRTTLDGVFPLGAAVQEARRSLVRKIAETGAVLHVADGLPLVRGDRSLVAQVFQNLISNSIKYRKKNEVPHIWIESRVCDPNQCTVSVTDNGIGFDMRHSDRIFGIFQRLYTVEQYSGTGIGLAMAKKIVERHGGKIWTQSEENKGTSFFFTLPTTSENHGNQHGSQHTPHRRHSQ